MTSGGADHAIAYRCRFHPSSPLWVPLLFPLFALCICFQWGGDIAGQLFVSRSKPIRKLLSNGHAFTFLRVSLFLPPSPVSEHPHRRRVRASLFLVASSPVEIYIYSPSLFRVRTSAANPTRVVGMDTCFCIKANQDSCALARLWLWKFGAQLSDWAFVESQ